MADVKMPLTAHLEELRKRLIASLIAVAIGFGISYFFKEDLFSILIRPLETNLPEGSTLQYIAIPEAFITYLLISLFSGFIGMKAATFANVRTSQAAREGSRPNALLTALDGGAVMGLFVASTAMA